MNEQKFICKKCGCTEYIIKEKPNGTGVAIGLYCAKCGTWQKWLNKQEKILYNSEPVGKQDDEQETREKIVEALKHSELSLREYFNEQMRNAFEIGAKHYGNKDCDKSIYDFWADALIAENIGDTSELLGKIKQLKAENDELRARLDKERELKEPRVYTSFSGMIVKYYTIEEHVECYDTPKQAEARLAELKGEKQ